MAIEIVNVVATAELGQPVLLDKLSNTPYVEYDVSKYRCAYLKDGSMEGKVAIFRTGKMIVTGAKSEAIAFRDLMHVTKLLERRKLIKPTSVDIVIRNIVVVVDLGTALNLDDISWGDARVIYEPEQFPGVIFRLGYHNVTALIFGSGKMVVVGLHSENDILWVVRSIVSKLGLTRCQKHIV